MHIIKNVTLKEIAENGNQLYVWDKPHPTLKTSLWLTGMTRNSKAKVGDKGQLEYIRSPNSGLWFFSRKEALMLLIYGHTKDGSTILITRTSSDTFNVQAWAEDKKEAFKLLGITRISYEVIKTEEKQDDR